MVLMEILEEIQAINKMLDRYNKNGQLSNMFQNISSHWGMKLVKNEGQFKKWHRTEEIMHGCTRTKILGHFPWHMQLSSVMYWQESICCSLDKKKKHFTMFAISMHHHHYKNNKIVNTHVGKNLMCIAKYQYYQMCICMHGTCSFDKTFCVSVNSW